ncbi:MAG TPA: hypothetical protein VGH67_00620 [Solirubrobacteraceae bacterium]
MDTYTPDRYEEDTDTHQAESEAPVPRRARRQFFNPRSAALLALVTCAIGVYAGIRVEKSQLSSSSSTTSFGSGATSGSRAAARGGGFAGLSGRGAAGSSGSTGAAGSPGPAGGAGAAGGFAGGTGGGNVSFGTVSSVNGKTLYVTDSSGNTVKVKLSSATKITKTQSVARKAIRPGDTIVVAGARGSGGTTTAASVTDSGNRSSGSSGSTGSSGSSGSGSGSSVGSLFSSGG